MSPRATVARVLSVIGLVLVGASATMPWLTVFNGLQSIPGFRLGGADLVGFAIGAAALVVLAGRHEGAALLRPLAAAAAIVVVVGAVNSAMRIAAYISDPGPASALIAPAGGVGPLVMAAGGVCLVAAAVVMPTRGRGMDSELRIRVLLAAATFVAGWMHVVLVPQHLGESFLLGLGFLVAGIAQLALAAVVSQRASDLVLSLIVTVNVALLALWVYAVLVGLPLGDTGEHESASGLVIGAGEPIDLAAVITKVAEISSLGIALVLLRRNARSAALQS